MFRGRCTYSATGQTLYRLQCKFYEFTKCPIISELGHGIEFHTGGDTICVSGPTGSGKSLLVENMVADIVSDRGMKERVIYLDTDLSFDISVFKDNLARELTEDCIKEDLIEQSLCRLTYLPIRNPWELSVMVNALDIYLNRHQDSVNVLVIDSLDFWPTKKTFRNSNADPAVDIVLNECIAKIRLLRDKYSLLFIYTKTTRRNGETFSAKVTVKPGEEACDYTANSVNCEDLLFEVPKFLPISLFSSSFRLSGQRFLSIQLLCQIEKKAAGNDITYLAALVSFDHVHRFSEHNSGICLKNGIYSTFEHGESRKRVFSVYSVSGNSCRLRRVCCEFCNDLQIP